MRRRPDDQRGGEAERRRGVRTAVLRGSAADSPGAQQLRPPPLLAFRSSSGGVHRLAQKVGLSLDEIRAELAKLPKHRTRARRLGEAVGRMAKPDRARIAELERLDAGLTQCIGCGCLSLDRCAMANPGDRVARAAALGRVTGWKDDLPSAVRRRRRSVVGDVRPQQGRASMWVIARTALPIGSSTGALRGSAGDRSGAAATTRAVHAHRSPGRTVSVSSDERHALPRLRGGRLAVGVGRTLRGGGALEPAHAGDRHPHGDWRKCARYRAPVLRQESRHSCSA